MNFLIILLIINYLTFVECFIMTFNQKGKNIVKNKKCLKIRKFSNENENEKYLYANYLVSLRKIKRAQKSINYNNIFSINNFSDVVTDTTNNNINNLNLAKHNELFLNINNTIINNNDKIAKNLILANIKIDVSNVKYIQISTKNDTMVIELDKNENNDNIETTDNKGFINYDLGKIDALISAISILMNLLNIH